MGDSYVCSKAKIKCSCGDKISTLTVFPDRTIWLTGEPQANISDHIPMRNIAPFGKCRSLAYPATASATAAAHGKLTPMPCVPGTKFPWMGGKNDVLLKGQPALLKSSRCKCIFGGTITITFDGQTDGDTSGPPTVPRQDFSFKGTEDGPVYSSALRSEYKPGRRMAAQPPQPPVKQPYEKTVISPKTASLVLKEFDSYSDNKKKGILRGANALPDSISIDERLKLAEHTTEIARALKMTIGAPMSIEQADEQSANPHFNDNADYKINCATVAATYALRLQGLNLTAKPKNSHNKLNVWLSEGNSFKVWKNVDGTEAKPSTYKEWMKTHTIDNKPITKMTPGLYKRFIEDNTKEEGVYIITVGWKTGGGHATIIQRWRDDKGILQLSYIEPQVYDKKAGVKQSIDKLVINMDENPSPTRGIMRVDNKKFDTRYVTLFDNPNGNTSGGKKAGSKPD